MQTSEPKIELKDKDKVIDEQDEETSEKIFIPTAVMEIFEDFSNEYDAYDYECPKQK